MNTHRISALLALLAALTLSACASPPKSYVVLLESPDGTTGQVSVKGRQGEQLLSKARDAAPLDGSSAPAPVDEAKFKRDFGDAIAARPALPEHFLLYFESGGTKLAAQSASQLDKIVDSASKRPAVDVSVIGHTDTAGKGTLNYVSGVIARLRPDAVSVDTPTGTIGVRGTQFVAKIEKED